MNLHFLIDVEKTASLRTMDLMAADGEQIDACFFRTDPIFSVSLDGIRMEPGLRCQSVYQFCCFFDRLPCSHFIVHIHDGNENRILPKGLFQILETDQSRLIHRKKRHLKALLLQIQHGL